MQGSSICSEMVCEKCLVNSRDAFWDLIDKKKKKHMIEIIGMGCWNAEWLRWSDAALVGGLVFCRECEKISWQRIHKSWMNAVDVTGRPTIKWEDIVLKYLKERGIGEWEAWRMHEWNLWIETNGDVLVISIPLREFSGTSVRVDYRDSIRLIGNISWNITK